MSDPEQELYERAQSIVKRALSSVGQQHDLQEPVNLSDVQLGDLEDDQLDSTTERAIADAALGLSQAVLSKSQQDLLQQQQQLEESVVIPEGSDDHLQVARSVSTISGASSLHHIPAAPEEEEEEEEEEEVTAVVEESREEFVIRKTFENFTDYMSTARLTEKRYLQLLREAGLIGPGTAINTTEAEIVYFKHVADRRGGMTLAEFRTCFYNIAGLGKADVDEITEEVLQPTVPPHFYPKIIMSVK